MRSLRRDDAAAIAALHERCLGGLLTNLGPAAIRAYYRAAAESRRTVAFVSDEGGPRGFVFGSPDTAGLWREVTRRHPLRLGWGVLIGAFRRPSGLAHLWRSLIRRSDDVPDLGAAQLAYLAVAPEARRQGVAGRLVAAFDDEMTRRGFDGYELSVEADNEDAIAFYRRLGFSELGRYDEFGERYLRLRRSLADHG